MTTQIDARLDRIEWRLRSAAPGEPARRLARVLAYRDQDYRQGRPAVLLELVARLADRLRADGVPVRAPAGGKVHDLDVWDLIVAERIPFEFPEARHFPIGDWFDDGRPGRRDLAALAEHPAFRAAFRSTCLHELGTGSFGAALDGSLHPNLLALARSVPGVAAALDAEVDAVTARAATEPGAELHAILRRLEPLRSAAGYAAYGRYLDRLAHVDPAASLARTLRCGLPEELVWPEYTAAVTELDPQEIKVSRQWPRFVVHDQRLAFVFDESGVLGRHELRVPDGHRAQCRLFAGQLGVSWSVYPPDQPPGYLAEPPGPIDSADAPAGDEPWHAVEGGRFEPVPEGGPVRLRWRRALPDGATAPFGAAGGDTGWDLVDGPGGPLVRSVDGREVPLPDGVWLPGIAGVLRLPGGDRLVTADALGQVTLWDPQTGTPAYGPAPLTAVPPVDWWDRMRPRDPAGSTALRAGTGDGVCDPVLRAAVERRATAAAELGAAIVRFRALADEPAPRPVPADAHDDNLANGLYGLVYRWHRTRPRAHPRPTSGYATLTYLETLAATLARPLTPRQRTVRRFGRTVEGWSQVLPDLGAVALRAGLGTTPAPQRTALAAFLTAVADAGLADDSAGLTVTTLAVIAPKQFDPAVDLGFPADLADARSDECYHVIATEPLPDDDARFLVIERVPLGGWGDAASLRRFVALLAERGPVPWRPEWVPAAVTAGLDLSTDAAETLLTGALDVGPLPEWEESTAPTAVAALPPERLRQLLNAAMPADPERLWTQGPDVAALAAAWRSALPPDPVFLHDSWWKDLDLLDRFERRT